MLLYVVGVGELMVCLLVCLLMVLKLLSFGCGYLGICCEVMDVLIMLFNVDVLLLILVKGLVGVLGDFVLFVYMLVVLLGVGEVFICGEWVSVFDGLCVVGFVLLML